MTDSIKFGDKLYIVTRCDIDPGYQAVQSIHAMRQFSEDHPNIDQAWYSQSNHIALLSVNSEYELMKLLTKAIKHDIKCSAFREPDIDDQLTAIALEPGFKTAKLCKKLQLALKS